MSQWQDDFLVSLNASTDDPSTSAGLNDLQQWRDQQASPTATEPAGGTAQQPTPSPAESPDQTTIESAAIPGLGNLRQWHRQVRQANDSSSQEAPPATAPKTEPTGPSLGDQLKALLALPGDDDLSIAKPEDRRGLIPETLIVLGLSLGASAVWAVIRVIDMLTRPDPIGNQTVGINNSVVLDRAWLDLLYQLYRIAAPLVPVVLVFFLLAKLWRPPAGPLKVMGIDNDGLAKDFGWGALLALIIGLPGLGLYAIAHAIGINASIAAGNLIMVWWTVPVYILFAAMNGILEEVVMIGYLFTRWTQANLAPWRIILISAAIRGTYHLYQGFGSFIGNFIMGVIFGWFFARTRRVLPLIIAHTLLDIVIFVGYAFLHDIWPWLSWLG